MDRPVGIFPTGPSVTRVQKAKKAAHPERQGTKGGRPRGICQPERVRQKIRLALIVNRFEKQALDQLEKPMSTEAIRTGEKLIDLCLYRAQPPDSKFAALATGPGGVQVSVRFIQPSEPA